MPYMHKCQKCGKRITDDELNKLLKNRRLLDEGREGACPMCGDYSWEKEYFDPSAQTGRQPWMKRRKTE